MFKHLMNDIKQWLSKSARRFKASRPARSAAQFALLVAVTIVFVIATAKGMFSNEPRWQAPLEFRNLKGGTAAVELEHQIAGKDPMLDGLIFFENTKDVVVLRKDMDDFIVRDADVDELKRLAAAAGLPVSTSPSEHMGGFFSDIKLSWIGIALGLVIWLFTFLFHQSDKRIYRQCRARAALGAIVCAVERLRVAARWRPMPFYMTLWAVLLAAFLAMNVSRVFHNPPAHYVPDEYDYAYMFDWRAARLLAKFPSAITRAVVIHGVNGVYIVIDARKIKQDENPGSDSAGRQPETKHGAKDQTPESTGRLVQFPDSKEGAAALESFIAALEKAKVPTRTVESDVRDGFLATTPGWLAIFDFIFGAAMIMSFATMIERRKNGSGAAGVSAFGKRGAIVGGGVALSVGDRQAQAKNVIRLDDVAGCDEAVAKFRLVAEWMLHRKAYNHFGAKLPKGVLLSGPPGTGKTLLARALAGEVGGNFFHMSASEFVEVYVGVGASRVRALFEQAEEAYRRTGTVSIIFIDEIDAIGKARSDGGSRGDSERDQTLNQLLTCMQGFDDGQCEILVIGATNRSDTLDPALTRSGRFDYKVSVDKPDCKGRKAIFGVHARGVEIEQGVDRDELYDDLARRTLDFVGADIEVVVNTARIRAAKRNASSFSKLSDEEIGRQPKIVSREDFHSSVDEVRYGDLLRSRVRTDAEKLATAHHEVGHACIPTVLNGDPVGRVTIVMTSKSLGLMESQPEEDRYGWSKEQFLLRIKTMLAGRVAEEILSGQVSTGAANDFERASQLARFMVGQYGMSAELGLISIPLDRHGFPGTSIGLSLERQFNAAWRKIINECEVETRSLITEHSGRIRHVAGFLLKEETLSGERFRQLWSQDQAAQ